ncbi:pyruvate decarboxylase 2 [Dorcoceras hygrometricum]|uniref:Pyruvate decarboxylase 2 n=1 Tax=Dorcoceras hygrometricum TaxID=472368 RepID=A0A2Z6ZUT6_9LAMI|nr:pyruvate decarboxylase 2 [Dorcoceras hygrometricum]
MKSAGRNVEEEDEQYKSGISSARAGISKDDISRDVITFSSTSLKRNQQVATVLPGVSYNEPAVATHPVVGKSSRELQCYCISSRLGTQMQEKKKQAKCRDSTGRELQYPVAGNPGAKNRVVVMNQQRSS